MRDLFRAAPLLGLLVITVADADSGTFLAPIGGFDGLSFGQTPLEVDGLVSADWMHSGHPRERTYILADRDRRNFLADVRLVWPGLLYRFLDNRLYAIEAEFAPGAGAFERLQAYLAREYGAPSMSESWRDAPADTYVYQHRLSTLGWYGSEGTRSIWLTSHDKGGGIIMIDRVVADLGIP